MASGFEPLPLFDCFYCCREHFVLLKCSEYILSVKYNHTLGMIDLASKRCARLKVMDDYEEASSVLTGLVTKFESQPAPALIKTGAVPLV